MCTETSSSTDAGASGGSSSAKARKRRNKKQQKKAEEAEADAMDEIDAAIGRISVVQEQIKGLYDDYQKLQAQLDVLSSRTANTPRGHTMLYDRKKSLIDQMQALLDQIGRLEKQAPGSGNVRDAKELEARFAEAVISGEANGAAACKQMLGELAERGEARREAAKQLAKSLRAGTVDAAQLAQHGVDLEQAARLGVQVTPTRMQRNANQLKEATPEATAKALGPLR
jgi:chromosome segregation ATPase